MTPSPPARVSARHRFGTRTAAFAGGLTALALVVAPTTAFAAPGLSVTGPAEPTAYTEQAEPVLVGEDVSVSGGSAFGGGYVDFAVVDGTPDETLSLHGVSAPDITAGAVSVVGDAVYLGSGSSAEVIGSIDPTRAGSDGNLRVTFTSPFANPSFEEGTGIDGWTAIQDRIDLGVTSIAGFPTVDRSTYSGLNAGYPERPTNDDAAPQYATYTVQRNTADASNGAYSLELFSSMTTAGVCDVVHGPAVYSDAFEAAADDKIYFDWRAYAGSDNFHVYGYILNTVTGAQTTVLDATGGNNAAAGFQTKETTIPETGTYRFVFVGGTHDLTCGLAAGARLLIDNVRVYGTKVTDEVVTAISRKLQYANDSDDPAATRTVRITAADNGGTTTSSADATISITPVDDAPTFSPVSPISLVNAEGEDAYATTAGILDVTDPDTDAISYRIVGDHAEAVTIDGVTYTHALAGRYGTLRIDEQTGRYAFVPDADAADARLTDDTEEYVFEISAPDESPGSSAAPQTAQQTLVVSLEVTPGAPSAPAATTATPGAESATVSWTEPSWLGGSAVTGYRIEQSADGGQTWTETVADTGSTSTSYEVDGLTVGEPVQFRVSAINENGTGAPGGASTAVAPYTTPGAPVIDHVLVSNGALTVIFTPPAEDGGEEITGYEYSLDGGQTWISARTVSSPLTVTGLRNGVSYDVQLRAVNAAGGGTAAEASETPKLTPVLFLDEDGKPSLPVQKKNAAAATLGGTGVPVTATAQGDDIVIGGDDFSVHAQSLDADGNKVAVKDDTLQAVQGGYVRITGEGYAPGSMVDLWLLGSNAWLGQAIVGADGTFDVTVRVPADVDAGAETLQINGISETGEVRSVVLGIAVVEPAAAGLATTGAQPALGAAALGALLLVGGAGIYLARRRGSALAQS
ncbi:fibronectin type III domain-containing protein [Microbacterium alcoholitolerans]|uniref:fibronectin type III domain-containing protein n=1 Tax=unclassified Microbacterium TaxID=2609290 RepID=UPI003D1732DE